MDASSNSSKNKLSLKEQVDRWIAGQGYPLEFFAADAFERSGFKTLQSWHIHDASDDSQTPREIDVIASLDNRDHEPDIKLTHVLECKYASSPWIVFSSSASQNDPGQNISQIMANALGSEFLHHVSSDEDLHKLSLFKGLERSGFNTAVMRGQQERKDKDPSYSALQSVVSAAVNLSKLGGEDARGCSQAAFFFPVIVIEGAIFEAYYDAPNMKVISQEVTHAQVRWRGLSGRDEAAIVDMVSKSHLRDFATTRKREFDILLAKLIRKSKAVHEMLWLD